MKRTISAMVLDGKYTEIEKSSGKTKSSMRTLPLVGKFREYFMKVKEAQELNKKICGNAYNYKYDGYVFVDEMGDRIKANYLTAAFPAFLKKNGLPHMRFHDLSHPYVKHATKNIFLQKQKSQAINRF